MKTGFKESGLQFRLGEGQDEEVSQEYSKEVLLGSMNNLVLKSRSRKLVFKSNLFVYDIPWLSHQSEDKLSVVYKRVKL